MENLILDTSIGQPCALGDVSFRRAACKIYHPPKQLSMAPIGKVHPTTWQTSESLVNSSSQLSSAIEHAGSVKLVSGETCHVLKVCFNCKSLIGGRAHVIFPLTGLLPVSRHCAQCGPTRHCHDTGATGRRAASVNTLSQVAGTYQCRDTATIPPCFSLKLRVRMDTHPKELTTTTYVQLSFRSLSFHCRNVVDSFIHN